MSTFPLPTEELSKRAFEPCSLVIFGATGDLTHRKLIPALYHLALENSFSSSSLKVIGVARRDKSNHEFREELKNSLSKFSRSGVDELLWEQFSSTISYHRMEFDDLEGYLQLAKKLEEYESAHQLPANRLFYFAVAPHQFEVILKHLKESKLSRSREKGWTRVVLEKPFGTNLETARDLNKLVHDSFPESSTYRIDHYLGKETAQNIMMLRFANPIFESLWNAQHIHHVQITAAESMGVEGRAGYYDQAGALRDMVQNHLLQLFTLIAMEPPARIDDHAIRNEKVNVLKSLRPLHGQDVFNNVVRAQYGEGFFNNEKLLGYKNESAVASDSLTETYVALHLSLENQRWRGVPFFIRSGKRMPQSLTEIVITFKSSSTHLFSTQGGCFPANTLVMRMQPHEGISLNFLVKNPASKFSIQPVSMDFDYEHSFRKPNPEAYERLLFDVIHGDPTLFARGDEVEEAWTFIDGIQRAWSTSSKDLTSYPSGTWGPEAAHLLLQKHGASWREAAPEHF